MTLRMMWFVAALFKCPDFVQGLYDEELTSVAHLGRLNPALATNVLVSLLNKDMALLADLSTANDEVKERVYWLLLIAGFLLCDNLGDEGDLFSVPLLLNAYSGHCAQSGVCRPMLMTHSTRPKTVS